MSEDSRSAETLLRGRRCAFLFEAEGEAVGEAGGEAYFMTIRMRVRILMHGAYRFGSE